MLEDTSSVRFGKKVHAAEDREEPMMTDNKQTNAIYLPLAQLAGSSAIQHPCQIYRSHNQEEEK